MPTKKKKTKKVKWIKGSEHPRAHLREQEYYQLRAIEQQLDSSSKTTEFDNDALEKLSITRDSPFNIDDEDPIDLDPRFFQRGPIEKMEYGVETLDKGNGAMKRKWPQLEPTNDEEIRATLERHAGPGSNLSVRLCYYHGIFDEAMVEAQNFAIFCQEAAQVDSSWVTHPYMHGSKAPFSEEIWFPSDGDGASHDFWMSGKYYMWEDGAGPDDLHNPTVPHAVATVYDSSHPRHEGMLRSELCVAVGLLKNQIHRDKVYIDHYIYPVLVVSFFGRFSARITQAYFQHGKVVVRPSRLIDLQTPVLTSEVQLLIRWLNSQAMGETRLPVPEAGQFDDLGPTKAKAADVKGMSSKTINVR